MEKKLNCRKVVQYFIVGQIGLLLGALVIWDVFALIPKDVDWRWIFIIIKNTYFL